MQALAVLADPVRLEIVELLAQSERTAGEIAAHFPVSGPAISRHLRVLRESGVATYRQDAQRRIYALNPASLEEVEDWAAGLLRTWHQRFDALGKHLDELAAKERTRAGGKTKR
jgi:DNA-binding transcriptional ArsR family regulator